MVACAATAVVDAEGCANTKESGPVAVSEIAVVADAAAPERVETRAAAVKPDRGEPRLVAAANFQVSVIDAPAWPESETGSKRLGYIRAGSTVMAYERLTPNGDCTEGWRELEGGGWICGRAVTSDLKDPRVRLAPKPADRSAGMPYRYGVNVGDGTPLYRRVLSSADREKYEKDHVAKREESNEEKDDEIASVSARTDDEPSSDRGERSKKDTATAQKPTLKDLRGRGVLVRKMKPGFIVALDRDFKAAQAHWWRTTFGFAVPFEKIVVQQGATKHVGSWFLETSLPPAIYDADAGVTMNDDGSIRVGSYTGVVGFAAHGPIQKIEIDAEGKKAAWTGELPRRSAVLLTGQTATVSGATYHQTSAGFYVQLGNLRYAKPTPPNDLGENEKWIDVDLTRQALVAFEGLRPVFATLVSSGRRNPQDKEHDFPTPTGTFWIREKHVTTTMDGDVAADGPYSIEDVPWVMYFQGSYALHGAFWHDQFGHQRSHGCVNLAPEDARTLFGWADPPLPEGWHGVFSKEEKSGTRIVIHEDTPPRRRRAPTPPDPQ